MSHSYLKHFRVPHGANIALADIDPAFKDGLHHDAKARALLKREGEKLERLQELLYAEHKRSLLICLQAMDAGGKDGTVRHVIGAMNPQGCRVVSFKEPAGVELQHDYLWRVHRAAPARGEVVIFNRSHYESVLIERVHKLVPASVWSKRYDEINDFERMLSASGTHIVKFFLHISKDEQLRRFKARLDDPATHWKVNEDDYKERARWDDYRKAYETLLSRCSSKDAPWFIIPSDHKWFRNLAISRILVEYLEALPMRYPDAPDIERLRQRYFTPE